MSRVILFTRTKHGADRVARGLAVSGVGAFAIHGNKSQNARQAALESFRSGKARVLVATDIAARGIDIDDISHVVNYDIPNIPESYVHRIGRTARAGKTGVAIALCAPEERAFLRDIERLTRKPLTQGATIPGLAEVTASLPPIPSKGNDRDESETFDRSKGRVAGRRHTPQARPATAWRDTDPARPVEAGANAPRSEARGRDDRGAPRAARPGSRDERGGNRGPQRDSERRGPPKTDRTVGDRVPTDRPRSDAARGDARPSAPRTHGNYGDRPFSKGPAAPRGEGRPAGDRPFQARDGQSRDGERRGPPRDGGRDNHRNSAPRTDAPRGDRGADRGRPQDRRDGPARDFKRPERANERGDERSREPVISASKPWDNRSSSNGEGRPQSSAPRSTAPRSDDRSPAGGRPEGARRPETRGPDGRPPNRWNSGDRPRGGDRPRPPAHAGRAKTE